MFTKMSSNQVLRRERSDQPDFAGEILLEVLRSPPSVGREEEEITNRPKVVEGVRRERYRKIILLILTLIVGLTLLVKCATDVKAFFPGEDRVFNANRSIQ